MHLLVYFGTLILCLKILDVFMRMCLHSYHAAYGWFSALSPSRRVAVSVLITFCFTPPPYPHFLSSLRAMRVILAGSEKLQANICLPV